MPVMEMEKSTLSEEEKILEYARKIEENKTEDENFENALNHFLNKSEKKINAPIIIGATPNSLAITGADKNKKIVINPNTILKAMGNPNEIYHGHELSFDIMKQLASELRNPVLILNGSHDGSRVAVTELKDKNNQGILIAVELDSKSGRQEVNRITSAYGKKNISNYIKKQLDENKLIACNKEKANEMFQSLGLQLPPEETFISFDNSIAYTTENVKPLSENLRENTHFHEPIPHDKLIPILNAKANWQESKLETLQEKRIARENIINRNQLKIEKLTARAEKLADRNKLFETLSLDKNPAVKLMIEKNEQRIQKIKETKIPNRERRIERHKERIADIDRKSEIRSHKLERCIALSTAVKSFSIVGDKRRDAFRNALDSLNKSTYACIEDKRKTVIAKQEKALAEMNSAFGDISNSEISSAEKSYRMSKVTSEFLPRLQKLDKKLAKIKLPENYYAMQTDTQVDKLIENTKDIVDKATQSGDFSVGKVSEDICLSNAELSRQLNKILQQEQEQNPFEYLKNAEMSMEDDYNSIDGIINNGRKEDFEPKPEQPSEYEEELPYEPPQEFYDSLPPPDEYYDYDDNEPKPIITSENFLSQMTQNGLAQINDDGTFKVNADYYKSLPKDERNVVSMTSKQAMQVMAALTAAGISFSATSRANDMVAVTVSNSDKQAFDDISKNALNEIVQKSKSSRKTAPEYDTVNHDLYKTLKENNDCSTRVETQENAKKITAELERQGIPFSSVTRKNGDVAITVSKSQSENAYQDISADVKNQRVAEYINPDFFKNLPKEDRATQRMTEEEAKSVMFDLNRKGVEHSAVLNGQKSAVTIAKKDIPKTGFFSRKQLGQEAKNISRTNPDKKPPNKNRNKGLE